MKAIPGRVFYDYDGKTVKDPVQTLGDAGLNAFRLETSRGMCLGSSNWINNASTRNDEINFRLDIGCIDAQVQIAQQARATGMTRFVLEINQGFTIPAELLSASYSEMIDNIKTETKRQLQPFIDAQVVPDVILFENEGSDGFLYREEGTGHVRGINDGKATEEKINQERCGQVPTGNVVSWPQNAGYLKAEVNACNEAISAAGFPIDTIRYGLHSHGQYVTWKEEFVHGPKQSSQSDLKDSKGSPCTSQNPIPADLLAQNVTELFNIIGFSAYPSPMNKNPSFQNLVEKLAKLQSYSKPYGKYTEGPLAGQYKVPLLGVEYASRYTYEQNAQEVEFTQNMFKALKQFPTFLGLLWYEAWYCYSNWEGGDAAMCRRTTDNADISGAAPLKTVKTWGAEAVSPWKR